MVCSLLASIEDFADSGIIGIKARPDGRSSSFRERTWCAMEKRIIAIGRENGSGGRETGHLLAEKLGIPFYDKELLALAAQGGKIDAETVREYDERRAHPVVDFMETQVTSFLAAVPDRAGAQTRGRGGI